LFDLLPAVVRTPLAFIIVLGVLVFIHELGHYLAARWMGVHVETFSIGFGQALATWKDRRGTVWKLAWIPLGGYVKLHGQERPDDLPSDVRGLRIAGRTFYEKQVWARSIVVAAGPIANMVLAAVLFTSLYAAVGRPVALPEVGEVVADSAAAAAGLQAGDSIIAIDTSEGDRQSVAKFEDIQRIVVAHPGQQLVLHLRRGDATLEVPVTPAARDGGGGKQIGVLGIRGGATTFDKVSIWAAIPAGIAQTWDVTGQTLVGVWQMIASHRGTDELGGPLRIAQLSGQVAQLGVASLVSFIALLSVNLALINLFPIPVLDGGHLLFFLAEVIRGRPLPQRAQEYGTRAGFALLIGLFVFATWNDLAHIGLFQWVRGLIG